MPITSRDRPPGHLPGWVATLIRRLYFQHYGPIR
jgi:hypothetical protein